MKSAQPEVTVSPRPKSKGSNGFLITLGIVGGLLLLLTVFDRLSPSEPGGNGVGNSPGPASPAAPTCGTDWTKCKDNADLVNNFNGWIYVKSECKDAANQQARYGTPQWPWFSFGSFYKGNNYVTSGLVIAIEPDAQFSNAFGAMVHSTVTCEYDLKAKKVSRVTVLPK